MKIREPGGWVVRGSRQARRPTLNGVCVFFAIVCLAYLTTSPVQAAESPQAIVVFADHLSYNDVVNLPSSTWTAPTSVGLMSVGLRTRPDPIANVYASLGAGDSVNVGNVSQGRLCSSLQAAGLSVELIGNSGTYDGEDYRPLLQFAPGAKIKHVDDEENGIVRDQFAPGGGRNDAVQLTSYIESAMGNDVVVVVHLGDMARLERKRAIGGMSDSGYREARLKTLAGISDGLTAIGQAAEGYKFPVRLYFIVADPDDTWDRLTPVVIEDIGSPNPVSDVLTSTTTHTPGLIASRDLAPSILDYLHVPIPIQMTGAPIEAKPLAVADRDRVLDHLDRVTYLDQRAQTPFFWGLGLLGGIVIFACVGLTVRGKPVGNPVVLYLLRVLSSWPLALLLAWVFDPHTMAAYLGWIVAWCLVVALLPSPPVIFWVTSVVIIVDAFFGSRLVAQTVLSAYMMSGIRFYGIGNEYMGVLIGGALMTPIVFGRWFGSIPLAGPPRPQSWGSRTDGPVSEDGTLVPNSGGTENTGPGRSRVAFGFLGTFLALTVFVLSFPSFGAKAGGAVTASATFLFSWWELQGRKITIGRMIAAVAIGFGLVFVWAVVGRALHLTPTHIDTAVGAASSGRFGYILGVAERKVGLAVKVALHPGTIAGVAALIVLIAGTRTLMRDELRSLWERRPDYRAVVSAGFRGCVVALLFNDSGIVAAILLTISLMLPVLYNIFAEGGTRPASFFGTPPEAGGEGVQTIGRV